MSAAHVVERGMAGMVGCGVSLFGFVQLSELFNFNVGRHFGRGSYSASAISRDP